MATETGSTKQHGYRADSEIGSRITKVTEDTGETVHLSQRLSMALQKGNVVYFRNTLLTE